MELKPCPFCGGPANMTEEAVIEVSSGARRGLVNCINPQCVVTIHAGSPEHWNSRAISEQPSKPRKNAAPPAIPESSSVQPRSDEAGMSQSAGAAPAHTPETERGREWWLDKVVQELRRAMGKFPTWPTDPLHALAVLSEEHGELAKAMVQLIYEPHKTSREEVCEEAIQTAAMGLRLVMSLGEYQFNRAEQHQQVAIASPPVGRWIPVGERLPGEARRPGKYRLIYNKETKKIDKVSNVDGLVAESFDPPYDCEPAPGSVK